MSFDEGVAGIAEARYAIRRAFRIIDDQARSVGLEPLEHQALLQILGAEEQMLPVTNVAERLDISPAFASRMVRQIEAKGYVVRTRSGRDRRVTEVRLTEEGQEILRKINADVRIHLMYFQQQLKMDSKVMALSVMAHYVGLDLPVTSIEAILTKPQPRKRK